MLGGVDKQMKKKEDGGLYFLDRIWVHLVGSVRTLIMDEAHTTRQNIKDLQVIVDRLTKSAYFLVIREDYKMEKLARLYIDEIVARLRKGSKRQEIAKKSYADNGCKPVEFSVGDKGDTVTIVTKAG
ncbi:hypothetical protein Tco_0970029 [Tanacetum coccineum]